VTSRLDPGVAKLAIWVVSLGLMSVALDCQAVPSAPAHIATELPSARLAGQGAYRWFGLKIYQAQLWIGSQGFQPAAPGTARFALDLQYAHAFDGREIAQKSIEEIQKLGFGTNDQRQTWLAQMEACFPQVEDGTHLTGVHLPGSGVRYYRDGKWICEIKDHEFATAFFAIWLDPRTSAGQLREQLLGNLQNPPS